MIRKITLYIIVFAVFEIIIIINGNSNSFNSDREITYKAIKEVNEMYRRVRRQNILSPQNRQIVRNFQPRKMWKKGIKIVILSNIMRNPKLFQGDIVKWKHQAKNYVNDERNNLIQKGYRVPKRNFDNYTREKRKATTNLSSKWDLPIKFVVDAFVDEKTLVRALRNIQQETCIRFQREDEPLENSYGLTYFNGSGCFSHIGRNPNPHFQEISLGRGCEKIGVMAHETFHALGLEHEQSRHDRDNYINVFLQNSKKIAKKNFIKLDKDKWTTYGINYDYFSIMHYPQNLGSKNGEPTTLPKAEQYIYTMGQAEEVAFVDYKILNFHYCSNHCPNKIQCFNLGYQDPNNCHQCKCPAGFGGPQCASFAPLPGDCGTTQITASNKIQEINIAGRKNCIFRIVTDKGMRIAYKLIDINVCILNDIGCKPSDSVSIKYFEDQSISGARFCNRLIKKVFISHGRILTFEYFSTCKDMFAKFLFKAVRISRH